MSRVLEIEAFVGGGGELPLREAVHAVVLDEVDHAHVTSEQVLEPAHADRTGIAVAGDADGAQRVVAHERARAHGGHAAVQGIEPVRHAQEVGGRLARAADTRELEDLVGLEREFEGDLDDLVGDGIVTTADAERARSSTVLGLRQAGGVRENRSGSVHDQATSAAMRT